jgi:hypothetical protein
MAVINAFMDSNVAAGKKGNPGIIGPGQVFSLAQTFEVAAADDNGSIYKLGIVGANMIPLKVEWNSDAIAGFTSADLGFYTEAGVEVDGDILMAQHDVNGGYAIGSELDALHDMGVANIGKKVYELLGKTLTTKENAYVLAIRAVAAPSAAGTVSIRATFIQG